MTDDTTVQDDSIQIDTAAVEVMQKELAELKAKEEKYIAMEAEYEKLKNKDYNFRTLKEKVTKTEKDAERKVESKKEELDKYAEQIHQANEDMISRQRRFEETQLSSVKKRVLRELCGDDEELLQKVEFHASLLNLDAIDEDQLRDKYGKGYILATATMPQINPINRANTGSTSGYQKAKEKRFTETDKGKESYKSFFPDSPTIK